MTKKVFGAALAVLAFMIARSAVAAADDAALVAAVHNPQRSETFIARDAFRHPLEELQFFGIAPHQTVVEIWPGGGYWTEILAPYLKARGTYYAVLPKTGINAHIDQSVGEFRKKFEGDPQSYGKVMVVTLDAGRSDIAPPASVDLIVTFRNLHNWLKDGSAEQTLAALYRALKPGGVLGVEDHRGRRDTPQDPRAGDGYVRQDYAIALIERAGFKFAASSEINANPKDTANWPKGVWTLPPTFALGDQDRDKYAAIGEADNFVLKFEKPRR